MPIRSVPYEYRQLNSVVSADYRVNRTNSLEAAFERENFRRAYRERDETWEDKIRLGYVNRDSETGTLRLSYEYGRRRGSDFVAAPLAEFYSISLGPVPTAATTNMASWLRNVEQFRRFDVADRNQNVLNARFNHGIGPALDASVGLQVRDLEYPASEYGRNDHHRQTSPSVELNWQPSPTTSAYGFYSFQEGAQHQAGIQPNACVIGNFYYFFSDGSIQTNATGVPPAPPAGDDARRDPAGAGGELAIAVRDGLGRQSALSDQPDLGRVSGGSQHGHGSGLSLRAGPRPDGRRIHLFEWPHENRLRLQPRGAGIERHAGGAGRRRLVRSRLRPESRSKPTPWCRSTSGCPCACSTGSRTRRIRDWHYDGVSVNPMPANNGAYLDFGPQDYKVHLFGALFRYEL